MKEIILLTSTLITALLGSCFFIFLIWFCLAAVKKRKNRKIGRLVPIIDSSSETSLASKPDIKSTKTKTGKVKISQSMDKFPVTNKENPNDQQKDQIEEPANEIQNFELDIIKSKNTANEKGNSQEMSNIQDFEEKHITHINTENELETVINEPKELLNIHENINIIYFH